jgi:dienelactone hydrolase
MVWSSGFSRRRFLAAVAAAPAMPAGLTPAQPDVPGSNVSADIGSLYGTILEATAPAEYPMSLLAVQPSEFGLQQRRIRQKTLELFLYRPDPVDPSPKVLGRWEGADWVQEKVEFATAPRFRVSGYVLSPKRFPGRRPAVVDLHSHGGMYLFGKEKVMPMPGGDHPAIVRYRKDNYDGFSTSLELCRRGYVVVSIDAFYFGERRTAFQDAGGLALRDRDSLTVEEVDALNRRAGSGESTLARTLFWAGTTWPGIVHWDDLRTVDYLVQRPDVDPARIGCVGISMGADRVNYLAALDERIACAVSVGWMSTLREMTRSHVDTHSFVHFLPGMTRFFDLPDLAGCVAPRPMLVQYCRQDALYPLAGMELSRTRLLDIYARAGASDRFEGRFYPVPHIFSRQMQEDAFEWMDRLLEPGLA